MFKRHTAQDLSYFRKKFTIVASNSALGLQYTGKVAALPPGNPMSSCENHQLFLTNFGSLDLAFTVYEVRVCVWELSKVLFASAS